jgi:hypothetical protein
MQDAKDKQKSKEIQLAPQIYGTPTKGTPKAPTIMRPEYTNGMNNQTHTHASKPQRKRRSRSPKTNRPTQVPKRKLEAT